jgi:predicted transcriptional regulator
MENILTLTKKRHNKTHVLKNANLSYCQLLQYLDFLLERGLLNLEDDNIGTSYRTTSKGLVFLNKINELHNILKPEIDAIGNKLAQIKEFSNC